MSDHDADAILEEVFLACEKEPLRLSDEEANKVFESDLGPADIHIAVICTSVAMLLITLVFPIFMHFAVKSAGAVTYEARALAAEMMADPTTYDTTTRHGKR